MRLGHVSLLLCAVSAALLLGVTLPARQQASSLGDAYRKARDARRTAVARLAKTARRDAAWQRVSALATGAPADEGVAVTLLRRDVLDAVRGSGVSGVRLSVRPSRAPVGATLSLSAQGSLASATQLTQDLTGGKGLVLEHVRWMPTQAGVTVEILGLRLLGAS